jgi:hypothetical protein
MLTKLSLIYVYTDVWQMPKETLKKEETAHRQIVNATFESWYKLGLKIWKHLLAL